MSTDTLDDPLAVTAYDVLSHAADQFAKGKARGGYDWHKAGMPVDQHTAGEVIDALRGAALFS